jgi:hypothetical protein
MRLQRRRLPLPDRSRRHAHKPDPAPAGRLAKGLWKWKGINLVRHVRAPRWGDPPNIQTRPAGVNPSPHSFSPNPPSAPVAPVLPPTETPSPRIVESGSLFRVWILSGVVPTLARGLSPGNKYGPGQPPLPG